MDAKLTVYELRYASTEQGLLNGQGGFGLRSHSIGMEQAVINKVADAGVFQYQSGTLALATTAELIDNPELPMQYPRSYRHAVLDVNGRKWGMYARTIFLGRDYLYYIPGHTDRARSGNIYAHVFLWPLEHAPARTVIPLLHARFEPQNWANLSDNPELVSLLTGQANASPPLTIDLPATQECERSLNPDTESVLSAWLLALVNGSPLTVRCQDHEAWPFLQLIFCRLPAPLSSVAGFATNWHGSSTPPPGTLVFQNEHHFRYQHSSHPVIEASATANVPLGVKFVESYLQLPREQPHHIPSYVRDMVGGSLIDPPFAAQWDGTWMAIAFAWELEDQNLGELYQAFKELPWQCTSPDLRTRILDRVFQLLQNLFSQRKYAPASKLIGIAGILYNSHAIPDSEFEKLFAPLILAWVIDTEACKSWPKEEMEAKPFLAIINWVMIQGDAVKVLRNLSSSPGLAAFALEQFLKVVSPQHQLGMLAQAVIAASLPQKRLADFIQRMDPKALRSQIVSQGFFPDWNQVLRDSLLEEPISQLVNDAIKGRKIPDLAQKVHPSIRKSFDSYFMKWADSSKESTPYILDSQLEWEKAFGEIPDGERRACKLLDQLVMEGTVTMKQILLWSKSSPTRKAWSRRIDFLSSQPYARSLSNALTKAMGLEEAASVTLAPLYLDQVFSIREGLADDYHSETAAAWQQAQPQPLLQLGNLHLNGWACLIALLLKNLPSQKQQLSVLKTIYKDLRRPWASSGHRRENKPRTHEHLNPESATSHAKALRIVCNTHGTKAFRELIREISDDPETPTALLGALRGSGWDRLMQFLGR